MKKFWLTCIGSLLASGCVAETTKNDLEAQAIQIMRTHHRFADRVDWDAFQKTISSTPAGEPLSARMNHIARATGDLHSFWISAQEVRDRGFASNAASTPAISAPTIAAEWIDGIAVIEVPAFGRGDQASVLAFANALQEKIESLATRKPRAWIIDLSKNDGGNMWPMLAGLDCFFANSKLGFLKYNDGKEEPWSVVEGIAFHGKIPEKFNVDSVKKLIAQGAGAKTSLSSPLPMAFVTRACKTPQTAAKIAVQISAITASSAEAVAISFLALPNAIFVGEKTRGFATGNAAFPLSDGSMIFVTTNTMNATDGRSFENGMDPRDLDARGVFAPNSTRDAALSALRAGKRAQ